MTARVQPEPVHPFAPPSCRREGRLLPGAILWFESADGPQHRQLQDSQERRRHWPAPRGLRTDQDETSRKVHTCTCTRQDSPRPCIPIPLLFHLRRPPPLHPPPFHPRLRRLGPALVTYAGSPRLSHRPAHPLADTRLGALGAHQRADSEPPTPSWGPRTGVQSLPLV